MKALSEISVEQGFKMKALSAYDSKPDERYISKNIFKGYKGNKLRFTIGVLIATRNADKIFIGHINLALVGLLIKLTNPEAKLYLIAHGVEVWDKVGLIKTLFLRSCYRILAVSNFTKNKIVENHGIIPERVIVFHNTIDPYFKIPAKFEKPDYILEKLKIGKNDIVLMTLGRISSMEGRKGYDKVMTALSEIKMAHPNIKYVIAGSYDQDEYNRIGKVIAENNLKDIVKVTGFISEDELTDYYLASDIFIMPSKQEGFGIVFVEAMACGVAVIAGNKDGSSDAVAYDQNNRLVNPDNVNQIKNAITELLDITSINKEKLQKGTIERFGFDRFKKQLGVILKEEIL